MTTAVKFWISLLLSLLTAYAGYSFWRQFTRAQAVASTTPKDDSGHPPTTVADAKLVDSAGKPFNLESLKGDVWLASFFFTTCPGPCAQMNRSIAGLQRQFPNKDLKFISITCDPANDTPQVLAEYAKTFQAQPKRWIFLTGPMSTIQHLGEDVFKITVQNREHSQRVLLVDRQMKVRGMYLLNEPAQTIALERKLKSLLDNTAPAATDDTIEKPGATGVTHDEQAKEEAATEAKAAEQGTDGQGTDEKQSEERKPLEEKPAAAPTGDNQPTEAPPAAAEPQPTSGAAKPADPTASEKQP